MSRYDGPVCYVGFDHEAADGHALYGGWHYTVVKDGNGDDMPGDPLVLGEDGAYSPADAGDVSHRDRNHKRLKIVAVMGAVGEPQTAEEFEATHRHLDELEARLEAEGPHPQEHDHIMRTVEEVRVVRGWLKDAQERKRL